MTACPACLRRTRLLTELSPALERRFQRDRPTGVLTLDDDELVRVVAGRGSSGDARPAVMRRSDDDLLRDAADDRVRHGVTAICRHDDAYPARLLDLPDPPAVLHVLGGLQRLHAAFDADGSRPTVAIVGARQAPDGARDVARRFGASLAAAEATVVSGMAFGIDAAAHEGALGAPGPSAAGEGSDGGGQTVAVLAGGVERASPLRHRELHRRIAARGAVVGELAPGTTPRPWSFPARNRLIAALSDVVLIAAAAKRSGSLSTALIALDLHRPVGVLPGPALAPAFQGSNALLRRGEGVHLILEPEDVRELLGEQVGHQAVQPMRLADPTAGLHGAARAIALRLLDGPRTIEQLLDGQDAGEILAGLGDLEAGGRLRRSFDGALTLLPGPVTGGSWVPDGR